MYGPGDRVLWREGPAGPAGAGVVVAAFPQEGGRREPDGSLRAPTPADPLYVIRERQGGEVLRFASELEGRGPH